MTANTSPDGPVWGAPPPDPAPTAPITSLPAEPTPPSDATFRDRTPGPSRTRLGLVAAGAVALVAIAAATSMAASPAPSTTPNGPGNGPSSGTNDGLPGFKNGGRDGFRFGGPIELRQITITAISGNDITLGTADGWHRTITITSSLTLTKGGQTITAAELKVGDQVSFKQTHNSDGSFTVTDLEVVVPAIRGQVSGVTSGGFKVTTRDGSVWTITTNGSTKVKVGQADGSLSDVKDGDTVVVAGNTTGENAMTALGVRVAPDRAVGTVTAKTADSITMKRRDGSSLVIHVDAKTAYRVAGAANAKLSDVAVGMVVGASGRARADGSIDADIVAAGQLRGFGNGNGNGKGNGFGRFGGPGFVLPDVFGPTVDDGSGTPTA
jgi:hypothetical protein